MDNNGGDDNSRSLRRLDRSRAARWQRLVWSRRAHSWDQHASPALASVTAAVLGASVVHPGAVVLDLGCGTGQISLPLASIGAEVLAIDVSPAMASQLRAEAERRRLPAVVVSTIPIEKLVLQPASFDLIVSSYALHHLRDRDKARLVHAAHTWLRPGGRLVIADMMLGRGASARDRQIIRTKLATFASRGPGGWWRIAKNAVRYLLRVQERPVSMAVWTRLLESAGFTSVRASSIVAEAGLVTGQRTHGQAQQPTQQHTWAPRAGRP
jgi:2-polyprenyl-3-methyl-5-hydroxy-6-metoxy-1,4-benzoquinol methylase